MRKVNLRNVDPAIDDPDASTWCEYFLPSIVFLPSRHAGMWCVLAVPPRPSSLIGLFCHPSFHLANLIPPFFSLISYLCLARQSRNFAIDSIPWETRPLIYPAPLESQPIFTSSYSTHHLNLPITTDLLHSSPDSHSELTARGCRQLQTTSAPSPPKTAETQRSRHRTASIGHPTSPSFTPAPSCTFQSSAAGRWHRPSYLTTQHGWCTRHEEPT